MSESDEIYPKLSRSESDEETRSHSRSSISVLSVAAGKTHSLALTDCGLYVWGSSKYGQLGLGKEKLVRFVVLEAPRHSE
jgi:alpha-tubulin suppressor-like RCC1 family protein